MKRRFTAICACAVMALSWLDAYGQQPEVFAVDSTFMTIVSDSTAQDGTRMVHYRPSAKVCSKDIEIHVKDGVISYARFTRGCPGNAQGICILIEGMKVEDAITKLEGIQCGNRGTSCPDQLANALKMLR